MKRSPMPARRTPMKRTRMRPKPNSISEQAAEATFRVNVHRRSGGRCELCGLRPATQIHHRRTREEKWSRWLVENGLDLDDSCHHEVIHANPDWARRHGLILSRHSTDHPAPVIGCSLDCPIDHGA